jgi:drug/metabolite transporter (DMT)-like permease
MFFESLLNQSLPVIAPIIFISLLLVTGICYKIGNRQSNKTASSEKLEKTVGTITGSMLALLGFILAISLSMADAHFEARRKLVLDEANAIGTARLRALAIGGEQGGEIARLLYDYVGLRMEFFAAGNDQKHLKAVYHKTADLQQRIWNHASILARNSPTAVCATLLSSLNEVFDLATTRRWAFEVRVPSYIINLLLLFTLLAMGMMGYYFGICGVHHPLLSAVLFIAFVIAILLVMDLNRPRRGLIQPEQSPLRWLVEESSR